MQNDMLARSAPPSDDEPVRRVDANLRSTYPFLKTRLFALEPHQYVIVFDRQDLPPDSTQTASGNLGAVQSSARDRRLPAPTRPRDQAHRGAR